MTIVENGQVREFTTKTKSDWLVYADWLEEQNMEKSAKEIRKKVAKGINPNSDSQFRLCHAHQRVLSYVRNHPRCCKFDAAAAGTYNSRRDPSKQYYLVNTLIRQGYILAEMKGNRYELHAWDEE